jgi:hypothetical protein
MQISGSLAYERTRVRHDGTLRDATETKTGQSALRKMLASVETAFERLQQTLIKQPRTELTLRGTVVVVPCDTLALLTLRVLLNQTFAAPEPETGAPYSTVSKAIAKAVENELNFRHWVASEREKTATWFQSEEGQEWAREMGVTRAPLSRADRMIADNGVTQAALNRWSKTFKELTEYKWSELSEYYCGDALLATAVEALPEAFEIHHPLRKGHPRKCVRLVEAYRQTFDDSEARNAKFQTTRKPMITRPMKWEPA